MKKAIGIVTALALGLVVAAPTVKPAEAHPALLFAAPFVWHGATVAVGWAVAAGLGGILTGAFLSNAFNNSQAQQNNYYYQLPPARPRY